MKEPTREEQRNLLLKIASIPVDERERVVNRTLERFEGAEKEKMRIRFENIFFVIDEERKKLAN